MSEDTDLDEKALLLRDQGRPFASIAELLALDSPAAAHASFNRALRQRSKVDQERLRSREMARLDIVASRLRGRHDLSVEEIARRMRGVKLQRKTLLVS